MSEAEIRALKAWIGREVTYTAPEELGRAAIRYFASAIGDDNPLYTDDEFARSAGYDGVIAPPTMICETSQYLTSGHIGGGHDWNLPLSGFSKVRGGNDYIFHRPALPTDVITARWRIESIEEKASSSGTPLLILISSVEYTNQDGELLATNRETLIYRKKETAS